MEKVPAKKRFKIFIDAVKLRHTSHWDTDMMSRAELEAAYGIGEKADNKDESGFGRAGKSDDEAG